MQQLEQYAGRSYAVMGEVVMALTFIIAGLDEHVKEYFIISFQYSHNSYPPL